jgi:hypothetical protein
VRGENTSVSSLRCSVWISVLRHKIHTVLTGNGMAFANLSKNREGPSSRFLGPHIFDHTCMTNAIEHRLTKPYHLRTNGRAERMRSNEGHDYLSLKLDAPCLNAPIFANLFDDKDDEACSLIWARAAKGNGD